MDIHHVCQLLSFSMMSSFSLYSFVLLEIFRLFEVLRLKSMNLFKWRLFFNSAKSFGRGTHDSVPERSWRRALTSAVKTPRDYSTKIVITATHVTRSI